VDEVIQDIFAKFPERDSATQPWSKIVFTREEWDSLHTVSAMMASAYMFYTSQLRGSNGCSTTACLKESRPRKPDVSLVIALSR
jgi:hypothetical protein